MGDSSGIITPIGIIRPPKKMDPVVSAKIADDIFKRALLNTVKPASAEEAFALAFLTGRDPNSDSMGFDAGQAGKVHAQFAIDGNNNALSRGFKGSYKDLFANGLHIEAKKLGQYVLDGLVSLRKTNPQLASEIDLSKVPIFAEVMTKLKANNMKVTAEAIGYTLIAADNSAANGFTARQLAEINNKPFDYAMLETGGGYSKMNKIDASAYKALQSTTYTKDAGSIDNTVLELMQQQAKYVK